MTGLPEEGGVNSGAAMGVGNKWRGGIRAGSHVAH